jgi:hypothetical protein
MAAVGLTIAAAIGGAWWHFTRPRIDVAAITAPAPRIEMMHPDTHEWMEQHFRADDNSGKDARTRIVFRTTGNIGWRYYREDHSLSEFVVTRGSGEELAHLFYSPSGRMIVGGYEKRNDGTMRRVASTGPDNVVTLTVFWQDGKTPFSIDKRKVDEWDHAVQYFYQNGARWSYQVASLYADTPTVERDYDTDDRLVRDFVVDDTDKRAATVFAFRGDGTRRYIKNYAPYFATEYSEHGGAYQVKKRGLKTIDEFDGAERLVRRITMIDGGEAVEAVDIFDPATGEQLSHIPFVKDQAAPVALPSELTNIKIERLQPSETWTREEKKVSDIVPDIKG